MQPAAHLTNPATGAWRISRDGVPVATLDRRSDHNEVVVAAELEGAAGTKSYRFGSIEEADGFIDDLTTSFAYLGCDVASG